MGLERPSVCACMGGSVGVSTLSNINISETSRPIKFYLKHNYGGGRATYSFGADRFKTGFHGNR